MVLVFAQAPGLAPASPTDSSCVRAVLIEESLVHNRGNGTLNISELPVILFFDYPQRVGGQLVVDARVFWNGTPANYSLRESSDGDLSLRVRPLGLRLGPGDTFNITVEYVLILNSSERIGGQPPVDPREALASTGLWNYSNPLIRVAAETLSKGVAPGNEGELLYRILGWMDDVIAYSSRVPARHPWEVLEERQGDCDDRSNLLVALLRSRGIPAYTEFGLLVLPGYVAEGSAAQGFFNYRVVNGGPHGWVRAYIDGRWIAVDTTFYRNATGLPSDHIEYSAYNTMSIPIVVTGWALRTDYVSRDASTLDMLASSKIMVNETVRVVLLGGCG